MPQSLLFIPDISGFTQFVNETEINHSKHIISELLDLLIKENDLGLEVAEIEGDAIFFYQYENIPGPDEFFEQVKKMFLKFHNHLKLYEYRRICPCGACSTATNLTLKFVVHAGDIAFIKVKDFRKPHGKDVVLVHRLLKNNIQEKEYLLITDQLMERWGANHTPEKGQCVINTGSSSYPQLGEVDYHFMKLDHLHNQVTIPVHEEEQNNKKSSIKVEIYIDRPKEIVFEVVSNFDYRHEWIPNVDEFEYEGNKVNRVGTKHFCVIGDKKIEFETVSKDFGSNSLVYGEKLAKFPLVKEFINYYIIESQGRGTLLTIEVHYRPWPIIGWFFIPFFRNFLMKSHWESLELIKKTAENKVLVY